MKAARLRAGLSVPDAAARVGIGADAVYRFERDANSPSLETLDKMAAAYGVLAGDLIPNSGGGAALEVFEPLAAALMGLSQEDVREQVLLLANQARLVRNAILRGVEKRGISEGRSNVGGHTKQEDDAPPIHGLELGEDEGPSNGKDDAQRNRPAHPRKNNPTP